MTVSLLFSARILLLLLWTCAAFLIKGGDSTNVTQFIEAAGYPCEEHLVSTEDGYLLGVQRIPRDGAPAVFLQHGLLDCSSTWVCNPRNESLAFLLSDAGYDVWLGNVRGNEYSLGHETLKPSEAAFWEFTMDEMARLDLPAMLDHVVRATGAPQVRYVAHSQGTAIMMMALSRGWGRVREMVSHAVLLGPVAVVSHAQLGLVSLLADLDLFEVFGDRSFGLTVPILERLFPELCRPFSALCADAIMELVGWDPRQMNRSRVPDYVSFDPAGTSVRNMNMWKQWHKTGAWRSYDFGSARENERHYGAPVPPAFHMDRIATPAPSPDGTRADPPLLLVSGGHDKLADPRDVALLVEGIGAHRAGVAVNAIEAYNHLDFLWAEDAARVVYPDILAFLRKGGRGWPRAKN